MATCAMQKDQETIQARATRCRTRASPPSLPLLYLTNDRTCVLLTRARRSQSSAWRSRYKIHGSEAFRDRFDPEGYTHKPGILVIWAQAPLYYSHHWRILLYTSF